ncbi:GntR family transcriptional regulator [Chakrabartyella piscis]|uniref:GntR family transcriptional regulator n=1 Tax=Chakrabartyella piscis TaxID=2918914 RepID=UPI00295838A3|nr:GntR family transcriptional regulator [Chakrabartyella piscis]
MDKKSLSTQAYDIIESKIISCEYAPGSVLSESILSTELQMSRTPIREALTQLEHVGLIKLLPKKGLYITEMSVTDLIEIYQTRELVEPYILMQYGTKLIDSLLQDKLKYLLHSSQTATTEEELFIIDNELHNLITSINRNKHISGLLKNLEPHKQRARNLTGHNVENRVMDTKAEHEEIIKHILAEDYITASQILKAHLQTSRQYAISTIQ